MIETKYELKKKRIRAFFLTIETKLKKKQEIDKKQEDLYRDGMVYRQMRLPVEKITKEYEDKLKEKIEHNIIKAEIFEATKKDLKRIMDLYNKSWLTSNTPFRPITVDSIKKIHEDPDTVIFIARVYGMDGGFVILDFEGNNKEYGIIAGLGVLPRFQRKGLGLIIGMAAWNYLKKRGIKELRCEVYRDNNISYSFIQALGFEEFEKKVYRKEDFEIEEKTFSNSPISFKP